MPKSRTVILFWQLAILVFVLVIWQWGFEWSKALLPRAYVPKILDPYFIAKPSAIWESSRSWCGSTTAARSSRT